MPGTADKFTQSALGRLLWPGMTSFLRAFFRPHERQIRPGDTGETIRFLTGFCPQVQNRMQTKRLRKLDRFLGLHLEDASTLRDGPMPDFHDDNAARSHQSGDVWHGLAALLGIEMHPDRGEHDDVESLAARPQQS